MIILYCLCRSQWRRETDCIWALDRLRSMYEACGARLSSVILTDRYLACMNAVSHCLPLQYRFYAFGMPTRQFCVAAFQAYHRIPTPPKVNKNGRSSVGSGMKLWHLQPRRHLKRKFSSLKSVMFQHKLEKWAISSRLGLNSIKRSL
jgi:hypothetical protein